MNDPEKSTNQTGPSVMLAASHVGEFVLDDERVCTPCYLREEANQITDDLVRSTRLSTIEVLPKVIVWQALGADAIRLDVGQKRRLQDMSKGKTRAAMAKRYVTTTRAETRRRDEIFNNLGVRSKVSAVMVGICTGLVELQYTDASDQEWPTDEELDVCRAFMLGATYEQIAGGPTKVYKVGNLFGRKIYEKASARTNGSHLARRLFEIGVYQRYDPSRIFGESSLTADTDVNATHHRELAAIL